MTEVCFTVPPWKPGTGLELDNTSMRVTPGHQFGQFQMSLYFQAIMFRTTLNVHYSLTVRAFDLILKMRARPDYQLSSSINYTVWRLALAFPPNRNHP